MSKCAEIMRWYLVLLCVPLMGACQEKMHLRFQVITPAGFDWRDAITRVVISAGNDTKVIQCKNNECPFSVKFSFSEGDFIRLAIHGYDAENQLLAAGYSPLFYATGQAMNLAVFFSRINTGAVLDTYFEAPPSGGVVVPYVTSVSDDLATNAGTLLLGGTRDGSPVDEVWFYDPYLLALLPLEPLSIPLEEPAVMDLKDGNYLIYGGRTTGKQLSNKLLFYSTTSLQAMGSQVISLPPETAPPPMAGAHVVEVGPFDRLYDNASGRYLLDAFLLLGAVQEEGDASVWWFTVYYDPARAVTSIETRSADMVLPTGVRAAGIRVSDTEMRIVVPEASVFLTARIDTTSTGLSFSLTSQAIDGLPSRSSWRLVPWGQHIVGVTGRTLDTQACDGRWFVFTPANFTLREVLTSSSHCESALIRMGETIVEAGGVDADGNPQEANYRLVHIEEGHISLESPMAIRMERLRVLPIVFTLPTGAVAVFGGYDPVVGDRVDALEMMVLDPRKTQEPQ